MGLENTCKKETLKIEEGEKLVLKMEEKDKDGNQKEENHTGKQTAEERRAYSWIDRSTDNQPARQTDRKRQFRVISLQIGLVTRIESTRRGRGRRGEMRWEGKGGEELGELRWEKKEEKKERNRKGKKKIRERKEKGKKRRKEEERK